MLIKRNPEIKKKKKSPNQTVSSPVHKIKKEPTPKSLPNLKTEKERGRRRVREREGEKELLSAAPETQKLKKNNMDSLFFLASPLILLVHVCT